MTLVHLRWATELPHGKVFVLYLLAVCLVAVVRSARIGWALSPLRGYKPILFRDILNGRVIASVTAKSALSGRVVTESIEGDGLDSSNALSPSAEKPTLNSLRAADSRFKYLVGKLQVDAALIQKLAWLTLLISILVVVYGAFPTLADQFNNRNVIGSVALLATADLLLSRLALGLAVFVVLYALASTFEVMLLRRVNAWQYILSQADLYWSVSQTGRPMHREEKS